MSVTELAQLKRKLFMRGFSSLEGLTERAQRIIVENIFAEVTKILTVEGGEIVDNNGKLMKLTTAIDRVFEQFKKTSGVRLLQSMLNSFEDMESLNKDYFRAMEEDRARYDRIVDDVNKTMKARIGINANGSLVKGGYLFKLVNDTSLANRVQEYARRGITNEMELPQYLNLIRTTIQGDENIAGGLTQHYRTFAYDAFRTYDAMIGDMYADKLGLEFMVYAGGLIETSRDFCRKRNNKVFSREEMETWVSDPDLPKTREERSSGILSYDPAVDMGRFNCRHNANWITRAQAERLRPELKQVEA